MGKNFILQTGHYGNYTPLLCAERVSIQLTDELVKYAGSARYERHMSAGMAYELEAGGVQVAGNSSMTDVMAYLHSGAELQWQAEDASTGFALSGHAVLMRTGITAGAEAPQKMQLRAAGSGPLYVIKGIDERGNLLYEDYSKVLLTDNSKIKTDG